mgnify:CR=1 FL=1|jgi:hypothetical protein
MQTLRSVDISAAEWRWVILISGILVTLTLLPYAWALASNHAEDDWQFMGMLANPKDGATYLSKIEQGRNGAWLFELRHTPERHNPAGFHVFYLMLGHAARLTGLSSVLVFHLARVATSLFMYIALYQLGATVWVRLRPRRLFFILIAFGSGLGWLLLLIDPDQLAIDLNTPEAFPFFSSFANPHFPLAIACLALITSTFLEAFRRGFTAEPTADNGGLQVMVLSMVLALIQPFALVPIGAALVAYLLVRAYLTRRIPSHELRWSSMLWLPAVPFAVYYGAVFRFNDVMAAFNEQNLTPSPAPHLYIFGYGMLLIVALPGLVRAVRRFERDGDQFMLLWFVLNVLLLYAPFNLQRRLSVGLIIPLVFFAVRSLEDFWFFKVPKRWRTPAFVTLLVLLLPTNLLNLAIPLFGVSASPESGLENGLLVESDYADAFHWLEQRGDRDAVALAAPTISAWIPAYTPARVVYGHEYETVPAGERLRQVKAWYRGEDCATLVSDAVPFYVRYIFWGPQEQALAGEQGNASPCVDTLPASTLRETFGDVTVYIRP